MTSGVLRNASERQQRLYPTDLTMASSTFQQDYPWITPNAPLVVAAPMMKITMARLAVATSAAGGMGFLAGGFDLTPLGNELGQAAVMVKEAGLPLHNGLLPVGVGFQNWGSSLELAVQAIRKHPVSAVWFFAPKQLSDLIPWTKEIRSASEDKTKIWIQIGTVAEAVEVAKTSKPDVLVIQGSDSGGHGLSQRASLITLLPEVADALAKESISIPLIAAGGIVEARSAAAALVLGADGICLGTRLLACEEAVIAKGYQNEILRVNDGGVSTVASTVYDAVRGIDGWPAAYSGRGLANGTYLDAMHGMSDEENQSRYTEAMELGDAGWGPEGRMTTYAGTGVGLVKEVMSAKQIVEETRKGALEVLARVNSRHQNWT